MTALALQNIETVDHLESPEEYQAVTLQSSALTLFTDFRRHEPLVLDGWMSAVAARDYMARSHARLRLVVDRGGSFVGAIAFDHLSEERMLKRVARGERRCDLQVMDLMVHRHELRAIPYGELCRATVSDVVDTLRDHGERHCLVLDTADHSIRGLIAASDVARRLQRPFELQAAPTFADVFAALHG